MEEPTDLESTRSKYEKLLERFPGAFYAVNNDWEITYWNKRMAERTETEASEVMGEVLWDVFPQLSGTVLEEKYRTAMESKERVSFETYLDSFDYWLEVDVYPDADGLSVFSRRITERKRHEQQLELAETMFQNTHDAVFIIDVDGDEFKIERVNEEYESLTGLSNETLRGENICDLFEDADAQVIREKYNECVERGEPIQYVEELEVPEPGSHWETRLAPVYDEDKIDKLVGTTRNITERRIREQELREVTQRLELIIEGAEIGTWDWNIKTGELRTNETWATMLGYSPEEIEPRIEMLQEMVHPEDKSRVERRLEDHLSGEAEMYDTEARLETKAGEWKWVRMLGRVVDRDETGEAVRATGIHVDVDRRKNVEAQLRSANERLSRIVSTQQEISSTIFEPERIKNLIVGQVQDLTGAAGAVIELERNGEMVYEAVSGIAEDYLGLRLPVEASLSGACYRDGETKRCLDTEEDDRVEKKQKAREIGIRSMLLKPLKFGETKFGVLKVFYREPLGFGDQEEQILYLMSGLLAAALWQSRQYEEKMNYLEKTEKLAREDQLTGLLNRRELFEQLEEEWNRSSRYAETFAFALLDLDHFKNVNDQYGHPVGDAVLRTMGNILEQETRKPDVVGRYGGEEFGVILPETDLDGAREIIERILRKVRDFTFKGGDEEFQITVSAGITKRLSGDGDKEDLVQRADEALYRAKAAGRDQVVVD